MGLGTEGNLVDVRFQNVFLVVAGFDLEGHQQFAEFAHIAAFEREEKIFGQLLGDRGGALDLARLEQGDPERFQRAQFIDAVVAPEAVILGGNDGIDEVLGNPLDGNGLAAADDHEAFARHRKDFGGRCFDDAAQRIGNPGQILHDDKQQAHQA